MNVKMKNGGTVKIPAEFQRKLGLKAGDSLELKIESGELRVIPNGDGHDEEKLGPTTDFIQGQSLSEALIMERRERAAKYQSAKARREGKTSEALMLEHYEKLARHLAECYTDGTPLSEDMIEERRRMESYLWERSTP